MMTMISQYNPEYDAKPWLNQKALPKAAGVQIASAQEPVMTTMAMGTTGNDEWDTGIPKQRPIQQPDFGNLTTLAMGTTGNDEWDTGLPIVKGTNEDPYGVLQNPWMTNSPETSITNNPFWEV